MSHYRSLEDTTKSQKYVRTTIVVAVANCLVPMVLMILLLGKFDSCPLCSHDLYQSRGRRLQGPQSCSSWTSLFTENLKIRDFDLHREQRQMLTLLLPVNSK